MVGRRTQGRKPTARQRNEDLAVPQGRRKAVVTRGDESRGGGKWNPVNQQARQLELWIDNAERPARVKAGAVGRAARHQRRAATCAGATTSLHKYRRVSSATMVALGAWPKLREIQEERSRRRGHIAAPVQQQFELMLALE